MIASAHRTVVAVAFALLACGCGGLASSPAQDAGPADVAYDAGQIEAGADAADAEAGMSASDGGQDALPLRCPGGTNVFPNGAPAWVTCSCPDAGCPGQTVCAWYVVPEGPRLPFGCAPFPSGCAGRATCACAGEICGAIGCIDEEAGLLCN